MTINQISVFLENKSGSLSDLTKVLTQNMINIRALTIAETSDYGILKMIIDDPEKTEQILKDAGFIVVITKVIAVSISDVPGGLDKVVDALSKSGLEIEYLYAHMGRMSKNEAVVILKVGDLEKAIECLKASGFKLLCQSDM